MSLRPEHAPGHRADSEAEALRTGMPARPVSQRQPVPPQTLGKASWRLLILSRGFWGPVPWKPEGCLRDAVSQVLGGPPGSAAVSPSDKEGHSLTEPADGRSLPQFAQLRSGGHQELPHRAMGRSLVWPVANAGRVLRPLAARRWWWAPEGGCPTIGQGRCGAVIGTGFAQTLT